MNSNNSEELLWPDNLEYNPITGELWRVFKKGPRLISCVNSAGYILVKIEGKHYLAHRVIWFNETGKWPKECLDHINGARTDNRFINLREASRIENNRNARLRSDNSSGIKGVVWDKRRDKWRAQLNMSGKTTCIGRFDTLGEAADVVRVARENHHGKFINHG